MQRAIYKVPDGKLIKILLEEEGGSISSIQITGDFFIYPEENIEQLEHALRGCTREEKALTERLEKFQHESPTEFFGLDIPSLVHTILLAQ
ncbi:hypothetical protein COV82_04385 [Candidatus Peregrinibacteria bacterium CG11_big_fil_rev_8_21_14_0_20_46_8]|nr:MAG: hypothetical protein COV82_04385 [Candidatus Peregrinibacteria bacterium CG11_big_fil_rev_8_21_14_0_20_46_8]